MKSFENGYSIRQKHFQIYGISHLSFDTSSPCFFLFEQYDIPHGEVLNNDVKRIHIRQKYPNETHPLAGLSPFSFNLYPFFPTWKYPIESETASHPVDLRESP